MCDFYALSCEAMQLVSVPAETLADELRSVSVACVIVDVGVVSGAAGVDVASSALVGGTDGVGVVLGPVVVGGTDRVGVVLGAVVGGTDGVGVVLGAGGTDRVGVVLEAVVVGGTD